MAIVAMRPNQNTGIKMGLLETLHEERKARLKRIEGAAVKPPENQVIRKIADIRRNMVEVKLKPSLDIILHELCIFYDVMPEDILSKRRQGKIALRRQIFMYLANKMTFLTNPQIAEKMDRDHTTVIYGIAKIQNSLPEFGDELTKLEDIIRETLKRENIPCRAKKT